MNNRDIDEKLAEYIGWTQITWCEGHLSGSPPNNPRARNSIPKYSTNAKETLRVLDFLRKKFSVVELYLCKEFYECSVLSIEDTNCGCCSTETIVANEVDENFSIAICKTALKALEKYEKNCKKSCHSDWCPLSEKKKPKK